jgi:putative proteasome-type protease
MTYCVGLLVEDGLVMIADTRTNAGVDNISSYEKLHVFETPGERVLAVATAGNLSITQTALSMVREGVRLPGSEDAETLETAPTMLRAAQLLGHALNSVRREISPSLEAESLSATATMLFGGQIAGGPMRLFLIYSQGNFIECGQDTPFLQIGEIKYGKPILTRTMRYDTSLTEATKIGLIAVDSVMRSNVAVGPPLDLIVMRRDALTGYQRRIEDNDPYFEDLSRRWNEALNAAHRAVPAPDWMPAEVVAPQRIASS